MLVFVTGGSGFIGGHVIEALSERHEVLAMARSDRSAGVVAGFGATPVRCDLESVSAEHLAGVDAIVHCAAFVEEWGTREQFWKGNVEGTTRMLAAAREAGVGTFVHIGTEAALFDGRDLVDVDEAAPYPSRQRFLYSETKAEAERRVLAANGDGLRTVSIRPRFVWGPRDSSVLPAVLEMADKGRFAWIGGGEVRTSTTHVANLVHGVELALERGRGGQAYFVADAERSSLRDFLTRMAATQGVALPDKSVPAWLARAGAVLAEGVWRLFRRRGAPPVTRFAVAMLSSEVTVDTSKAEAELHYRPVLSREEGLTRLAA